mmetsp:Transcript_2529/g.6014  ORF Transcript_2529/g.6014 Transcript_2529/m.6014 type:complete len:222 (-) Transcript_2529:747-1412(-)
MTNPTIVPIAYPALPARSAGLTIAGQPRSKAIATAVPEPPMLAFEAVSTASIGHRNARPAPMMMPRCTMSCTATKARTHPLLAMDSREPASAPTVAKKKSSRTPPICCAPLNGVCPALALMDPEAREARSVERAMPSVGSPRTSASAVPAASMAMPKPTHSESLRQDDVSLGGPSRLGSAVDPLPQPLGLTGTAERAARYAAMAMLSAAIAGATPERIPRT